MFGTIGVVEVEAPLFREFVAALRIGEMLEQLMPYVTNALGTVENSNHLL